MLRFVLEGGQHSRVTLSSIRHPVGLACHRMPADSKDDSQNPLFFCVCCRCCCVVVDCGVSGRGSLCMSARFGLVRECARSFFCGECVRAFSSFCGECAGACALLYWWTERGRVCVLLSLESAVTRSSLCGDCGRALHLV